MSDKSERNLRALIGLLEAQQRSSVIAAPSAGITTPVDEPSMPISWQTPKKKKKSITGLISRLRDPKPLTDREEKRLNIALAQDRIVSGEGRTDDGALMNLRSQYPTF